MGTARSVFFTASSIAMIFSGILGFITAALVTTERLNMANASVPAAFITMGIIIIYSITNIICGIAGAKKYNRRINSSVIIRIPEISIVMCILSLIFSLFNGIRTAHMLLIILSGIVVPLVFIVSAIKKSSL